MLRKLFRHIEEPQIINPTIYSSEASDIEKMLRQPPIIDPENANADIPVVDVIIDLTGQDIPSVIRTEPYINPEEPQTVINLLNIKARKAK
jgi:hypothetical protein